MNEQLEMLILNWSDKLGIGIEFIWTAMIKQAFVDICFCVLFLIPMLIFSAFLAIKIKKRKLNKSTSPYDEMNSLLLEALMGLSCLIVILLVHCVISGLLNPEYVALQHLLS